MNAKEFKKLKIGDMIHWQYDEPDARDADSPCDGIITDANYLGVMVSWNDGQCAFAAFSNDVFWKCVTKLETTANDR